MARLRVQVLRVAKGVILEVRKRRYNHFPKVVPVNLIAVKDYSVAVLTFSIVHRFGKQWTSRRP